MRVALDLTFAGRNPTGAGIYSRELLAALRRRAATAPLDQASPLVVAGFGPAAHPPPASGLGALRALALEDPLATHVWLPLRLLAWRPAVVHSTAFVGPLWGPGRLVVTVYDTIFRHFPEDYNPLWLRNINTFLPLTLRRARAIICISEATRADLLRAYRVPPGKVHIVPVGLSPAYLTPISLVAVAAVRAHYDLAEPYVLHAGALVGRKNLPLLVRAFGRYVAESGDSTTRLVLTGGEARLMKGATALKEAIGRSPVRDRVRLLGHVPPADLPILYAGAALLAYPTLYEGAGLPPLEAMAVGTPTLVSTTPAVRETVGDAALLADPTDEAAWAAGLRRGLQDAGLRAALIAAGRRHAAAFTWDRCAARTLAIYQRVLKGEAGDR